MPREMTSKNGNTWAATVYQEKLKVFYFSYDIFMELMSYVGIFSGSLNQLESFVHFKKSSNATKHVFSDCDWNGVFSS